MDLKKAFDTVDHEILLEKLKFYGFKGNTLKWFKSYLENRKQCIKFKNTTSGPLPMVCGVPQGSILGPLLFILYINDLSHALNLTTLLFADDTTFIAKGDSFKNTIDILNKELQKASEWFRTNRLSLHPKKITFIAFNPKPNEIIENPILLGVPIQRIQEDASEVNKSFKYVGVHLDEHLNWKHHTAHISKKIRTNLFLINRAKRHLSKGMRIILYSALIQPHLDYCNTIWGGALKNIINSVYKLQKKAIRIITLSDYSAHTKHLFKQENLLPLRELISINELKLAHRIWYSNAPEFIREDFKVRNLPSLRNKLHFDYPLIKKDSIIRLPLYRIPKAWNSVSKEVKQITNKKTFAKRVKKALLLEL